MKKERYKARVVVYHLDGRSEEVLGLQTAADIAGVSTDSVERLIRTGGTSRKGYGFDHAADYTPQQKGEKRLRLTSPSGETMEISGLGPAAKRIGVSVTTIMRNRTGCHGWKIEEVQG